MHVARDAVYYQTAEQSGHAMSNSYADDAKLAVKPGMDAHVMEGLFTAGSLSRQATAASVYANLCIKDCSVSQL